MLKLAVLRIYSLLASRVELYGPFAVFGQGKYFGMISYSGIDLVLSRLSIRYSKPCRLLRIARGSARLGSFSIAETG